MEHALTIAIKKQKKNMELFDYFDKKAELDKVICELEHISGRSVKNYEIFDFITTILEDNAKNNDVIDKLICLANKVYKLINEINDIRFNKFIDDIDYFKKKSLIRNVINNMNYDEVKAIYNYLVTNHIIDNIDNIKCRCK